MRSPANLSDRTSRNRAAAARTFSHYTRVADPTVPGFTARQLPRLVSPAVAVKRARTAEVLSELRADPVIQAAFKRNARAAEHAQRFGAGPVSTARKLPTPAPAPFRVKLPVPVVGYAPKGAK